MSIRQLMYEKTEKQLREMLHAHPKSPCVHERLATLLFKAYVWGRESEYSGVGMGVDVGTLQHTDR